MKTEIQQIAATASDRLGAGLDRAAASRPSWTILVQLFLALGWARASVAKAIRPQWWDGTDVEAFVANHEAATIAWYQPIASLASTLSVLTAAIVLALELAIAVAFFLSRRVGTAIIVAVFLNLNFILVGQPNPAIFYVVMQVGLGLWIIEEVASREVALRMLKFTAVALTVIGVACLPFISTMHPSAVIEDPATVIATGSFCTVVACYIARSHLFSTTPADTVIVLD